MKGTYSNNKTDSPMTFEKLKKAFEALEDKRAYIFKGVACSPEGFKELMCIAVKKKEGVSIFAGETVNIFVNEWQKEKFIPIWEDMKMKPFSDQKLEIKLRKKRND